jgi:hypothetical protein
VTSCYLTYYEAQPGSIRCHSNSNASTTCDTSKTVDDSSIEEDNLFINTAQQGQKQSKALEKFRNSIKRRFASKPSDDISELLIGKHQLCTHFQEILGLLGKSDDYAFIELEVSLAMSKYLIENQMQRADIFYFINNSIYVKNLRIREESRVIF